MMTTSKGSFLEIYGTEPPVQAIYFGVLDFVSILRYIIQSDPDHPAAIFSTETVKKFHDHIGVKLLLENSFDLFSGPNLVILGVIMKIEKGEEFSRK